jgi:hypothetical protein
MKRMLLITAFFVSVLAGMSCDLFTDPENPPIKDNSVGLVPMKLGNKWVFRYIQYDTAGGIEYTRLDSAVVSRDTLINAERWYKIRGLKPASGDGGDWYTNRNDGVWVLRSYLDTAIAYVQFKFPTYAGESWGNQIQDSSRALAVDSVVVTPPSRQDTCILYETSFQLYPEDGIRFIYSFAPYKGFRLLDIYSTSDGGRLYLNNRFELVQENLR